MMNKALVEIVLPSAGRTFDVLIPLESKMRDVVLLAATLLGDLSEGKYKAAPDAILCNAATGEMYDINMYVSELDIQNGSRLMLI